MFHPWLGQSKSPTSVDVSPLPDLGLGAREKAGSSLCTLRANEVEGSFQRKPCLSISPFLFGLWAQCQQWGEQSSSEIPRYNSDKSSVLSQRHCPLQQPLPF